MFSAVTDPQHARDDAGAHKAGLGRMVWPLCHVQLRKVQVARGQTAHRLPGSATLAVTFPDEQVRMRQNPKLPNRAA